MIDDESLTGSGTMTRIQLTSDYDISRVIKGGWQISQGHLINTTPDREKVINDTIAFIRNGMTTLDFGDIYLGVEEIIGECLRRLQNEFGNEMREKVQLHTKYVPDLPSLPQHRFKDIERIIDRSRERLGVDRLDLVQFHWWDYNVKGYVDAMLGLQRLQDQGKIRLLGVTNFDADRLEEFIDAGAKPSTIQLQYSVLDHRPENKMTRVCEENNIAMLCYGTVAGGFLSEKYLNVPEPRQPFQNRSLTKYKLIIDEFGDWNFFQTLLQTLKVIGDRHGASVATIASAYVLQKKNVAGVIVGAHDASHLNDNLQIANVRLTEADLNQIQAVTKKSSGPNGDVYDLERNDPKHAGIMHTSNNIVGS